MTTTLESDARRVRGGCVGGRRPAALALAAVVLVLAFMLAVPPWALAHVPQLPSQGTTLGSATHVEDPAKSWAIYGDLREAEDVWYYELDLKAGDRIWLSLLTPVRGDFTPSLAVMGPGLPPEGRPPAYLETPPAATVVVREGVRGPAEYEPFTPGAYYFTVEYDIDAPADGPYYVAVFDSRGLPGPFSLAVGYQERFSVPDWVLLPIRLASIYHWSGQSWIEVFAPLMAVLAVGSILLVVRLGRRTGRPGVFGWLAASAGLLALGSSASTLTQMLRAMPLSGPSPGMTVTVLFVALPALFGGLLLRAGLSAEGPPTTGQRVAAALLGLACLALLAGYLAGPALALIAALLPSGAAAALARRSPPQEPDPVPGELT